MIRMKVQSVIIILCVFLWAGCSKTIQLALHFIEGDEHKYQLTQESTTTTEFMGKKMEMPSKTNITLTQKAEKVDQGVTELKVTYDTFDMEMTVGGKAIPSTMGKSMVGKVTIIKIGSNGEVLEPQGSKTMLGIQGIGTDVKNIYVSLYPRFPKQRVKVGDSWKQTQTIPQSQMEMVIESQYTLSKLEKKKGYDCAVIDYTVSMNIKGGDQATTSLKGSGSGKGTTYFAYDKGLLVESQADMDLTMSISAPLPTGKQEIPTSTKQKIQLSLI